MTFGVLERKLADHEGFYRGWCRNFVAGTASRMNTPPDEVVAMNQVIDNMKKEVRGV